MALLTHCHPPIHPAVHLWNTSDSSTMVPVSAAEEQLSRNSLPWIKQMTVSTYTYGNAMKQKYWAP